jgi:hypothetical protein
MQSLINSTFNQEIRGEGGGNEQDAMDDLLLWLFPIRLTDCAEKVPIWMMPPAAISLPYRSAGAEREVNGYLPYFETLRSNLVRLLSVACTRYRTPAMEK